MLTRMATADTIAPLSNIDEHGVELRLTRSVIIFGVALAAIVSMRWLGAPTWAFSAVFLPFFVAYALAYQGLFRT